MMNGGRWCPRSVVVSEAVVVVVSIPPAYSLAICSNHTLAKAKAKANYDEWPLAGYPARKAGEIINCTFSQSGVGPRWEDHFLLCLPSLCGI